jgi:hypothetical protein
LEIKVSLATSRRPTDRVTILYAKPYEVTDVNGATSVASIQRFAGEYVIPTDTPNGNREDFAYEVASLIGNAVVKAIIKDRDTVTG